MRGTSFDSTKTTLQSLLDMADRGTLQLPDFQRGWVWSDERIKGLLSSVATSYPIGALMLLETGGDIGFKPRWLEGAGNGTKADPETLVLDGQQRLTSLYRALWSKSAVETKDSKGKPIARYYYIDMKQAVGPAIDREDALRSVPKERLVKRVPLGVVLDVTTPEREYALDMFPLNRVFSSASWRREYNRYWQHASDKVELFDQFEEEVIKRFEQYHVPVIELKKETPKDAVCLVFERVNTGGVALTVFELLTASFAADGFELRKDWDRRERALKKAHPVLHSLRSDDFLQTMSLLVTMAEDRGVSCKRKDILRLRTSDWVEWADRVQEGFVQAARFMSRQNIFKARDLPYRTQLVPLTAVFTSLGRAGESEGAQSKIARWYWCGVFGELYGGAIETRFARDLPELLAFVREEGGLPSSIGESTFQAERLLTLCTRNSAAYKGLYALLMRDGCQDFRTGESVQAQTFHHERMDIHHIFPQHWCKNHQPRTVPMIEATTYNSVINKTAISALTNRQIGGNAPSKYIRAIERRHGVAPERMDEILASHCIEARHLRTDDFWAFFSARAEALLGRIESVTGRPITRSPELFGAGVVADAYDEGPPDWEEEAA